MQRAMTSIAAGSANQAATGLVAQRLRNTTPAHLVPTAAPHVPFHFVQNPTETPAGRYLGPVSHGSSTTTTETPRLLTPLVVRGVEFANRVGVAPMCMYSCTSDGALTPFHKIHHGSFALHGAGMIIVEATAVEPRGRISPNDSGLWNNHQAGALREVVDIVHASNGKIGVQLAHAGRKASTVPAYFAYNKVAWEDCGGFPNDVAGPSSESFLPGKMIQPFELSVEEIEGILENYRRSAKLAVSAGVDFVEIHGAHGYLINNFLSLTSNKRTDKYGGSFENRIRFAIEVVRAVRSVVPKSMPVFFRLSASENLDESIKEAWTINDTLKLVEHLIPEGVDLIDVSSGGNDNRQHRRGHSTDVQLPMAKAIKNKFKDRVLVAAVGGHTSGKLANEVVENGDADAVFAGRAFLKNPGLVWQWANELGGEIAPHITYSGATSKGMLYAPSNKL